MACCLADVLGIDHRCANKGLKMHVVMLVGERPARINFSLAAKFGCTDYLT